MNNFLEESLFAGVTLSLIAYLAGSLLRKKFKLGIFNPLLIGILLTMLALLLFDVDYETYREGADFISYLLTPATVCLAIPLYERFMAHCRERGFDVQHGEFGADMQVYSQNDGPVTILFDTEE